jgi:hypothetical protein
MADSRVLAVSGATTKAKYFRTALKNHLDMTEGEVRKIADDPEQSVGVRAAAFSVLRSMNNEFVGAVPMAMKDLSFVADRVDGRAAQEIEFKQELTPPSPGELLSMMGAALGRRRDVGALVDHSADDSGDMEIDEDDDDSGDDSPTDLFEDDGPAEG